MSRIVNCGNRGPGCSLLFDGDDEMPSPSASMVTTKNFEGSYSFPGPIHDSNPFVVPPNHVSTTIAFERSAASVP